MLHVTNLTKRFGPLTAVDNVSFDVKAGELFGFLGPNGAGKTTTINMICSLLRPDSGSVFIDGQQVLPNRPKLRQKFGVVPQEIALYEELTATDNLKFWGGLYGLSGTALKRRIDELLELTGLNDRAKEPVKRYSGGMKRRLNMAAGMLHNPTLLLLDEPTVGIDPQARYNMLDTIRQCADRGTTIIYTTHYLDEAENLCERLAIMDHGRFLAMGTQEEIRKIVGENTLIRITGITDKDEAESIISTHPKVHIETMNEDSVVYSVPQDVPTGQFIESMIRTGFSMNNLQIKEPSLDSVFIKLTGRELRD